MCGPGARFKLWKGNKIVKKILIQYKPDLLVIEELFFAKNASTAMLVGQARGVILLTAIQKGLAIKEFTPLQVKQALTGYGRAEKNQIQKMVALTLQLPEKKLQDDAADALAIAITCGASLAFLQKTKK